MKKTLFCRTILLCTAIVLSTQAITTPYQAYAMANTRVNPDTGKKGNTDDSIDTDKKEEIDKDIDKKVNTDGKEDNKNNTKEKGITIQIGKSQKTVEILKGSFVKKNGIKYFKKQDGKKVKGQFFGKGKNLYYANKKGKISLGWKKIQGHYYFFDRKSGKLIYNKKADKIKIGQEGIAAETKQNIAIINVYLDAQKVMNAVSKPIDNKSQKLYKCFLWMKKVPYKRFRTMKAAKASHPKDWDVVFANDIFKTHSGCCASEACAFAYLAKTCGYETVKICSDTGHAWGDSDGKLYDPLFAESKSFSENYNANYTDYRINPAYTKKL